MDSLDKLSIFLSLVLRHKPEEAGIILDEHGWADVEKLIDGINRTGRTINIEMLEEIVATDKKQRYSFSQDKTRIRANQGHSIPVDVELKEEKPPEVLYHGTSLKAMESIKKEGLRPMARLYVHLSKDVETAKKVGGRHGKPVVLKIDSGRMYQDGYKFYISQNGVWLVKRVEIPYIERM